MNVIILNKSDSTGGAAVVSRRLLEALRGEGINARMLVCEKLTESPYVETVADPKLIKWKFLLERLRIFIRSGFNKGNLFKIDTGEEGLPLCKHPLVKEADAILVNWVNQGMLSLNGFKKILKLGKPVIWTMHDMWNMTGICHHAGECKHFEKKCGICPLLNNLASKNDFSNQVWEKKNNIYNDSSLNKKLAFVAVSHWLGKKAIKSSLLKNQKIKVIPNAFPTADFRSVAPNSDIKSPIRILFGAARLDDPIKGLDTFKETSKILSVNFPEIAKNIEIALLGSVKNQESLEGFNLPLIKLGTLYGEEVKKAYEKSHIVVSASSYETLPGTLVEAQAYGCIPVSFNQGGQTDIIDSRSTGFIADYNDNLNIRAHNLAKEIVKAYDLIENVELYQKFLIRMKENVEKKFAYPIIARNYISLIKELG